MAKPDSTSQMADDSNQTVPTFSLLFVMLILRVPQANQFRIGYEAVYLSLSLKSKQLYDQDFAYRMKAHFFLRQCISFAFFAVPSIFIDQQSLFFEFYQTFLKRNIFIILTTISRKFVNYIANQRVRGWLRRVFYLIILQDCQWNYKKWLFDIDYLSITRSMNFPGFFLYFDLLANDSSMKFPLEKFLNDIFITRLSFQGMASYKIQEILNEFGRIHLTAIIKTIKFHILNNRIVKVFHFVLGILFIRSVLPHSFHELFYLFMQRIHMLCLSSKIVLSQLFDIQQALECTVDETCIDFISQTQVYFLQMQALLNGFLLQRILFQLSLIANICDHTSLQSYSWQVFHANKKYNNLMIDIIIEEITVFKCSIDLLGQSSQKKTCQSQFYKVCPSSFFRQIFARNIFNFLS